MEPVANDFWKIASWKLSLLVAAVLSFGAYTVTVQAQEDKIHKVVIQVSHPDPAEHKIALNMASNLQRLYGIDNVEIEIVAFGRGLSILTAKSPEALRVKSLAVQNVKFSACANTMDKIERTTGKKPTLTEGVGIVPAGVARIVELQEQGYAYTAP
ncbi:MAG: DsrE family protein [Gammaproteobacteria bacterium]